MASCQKCPRSTRHSPASSSKQPHAKTAALLIFNPCIGMPSHRTSELASLAAEVADLRTAQRHAAQAAAARRAAEHLRGPAPGWPAAPPGRAHRARTTPEAFSLAWLHRIRQAVAAIVRLPRLTRRAGSAVPGNGHAELDRRLVRPRSSIAVNRPGIAVVFFDFGHAAGAEAAEPGSGGQVAAADWSRRRRYITAQVNPRGSWHDFTDAPAVPQTPRSCWITDSAST